MDTFTDQWEEYKRITLDAAGAYNEQDYVFALEKFHILAEKNPTNYKIHELLVIIYLKLNRLEDARREYDIYFNLIKEKIPGLASPQSFEDVVKDIGNREELEEKYRLLMQQPADGFATEPDESIAGIQERAGQTSDAINLAILNMAEGKYAAAREIIQGFINKYYGNISPSNKETSLEDVL